MIFFGAAQTFRRFERRCYERLDKGMAFARALRISDTIIRGGYQKQSISNILSFLELGGRWKEKSINTSQDGRRNRGSR